MEKIKEEIRNLRERIRENKIEIEWSRKYVDSFAKSVKHLRMRIESLEHEILNMRESLNMKESEQWKK